MSGPDPFTLEFFSTHLGKTFEIEVEGRDPYRLELVEARAMGGESDARQPFSVMFRARGEDAEGVLPQRIYRLRHQRLEPLDLFLVPLGPERGAADSLLYEAVFA